MTPSVAFVPEDLAIDAAWLEAALAKSGVSASALARRLGADVGTVSRWRRGVSTLSRTKWIAVLSVLGLPLSWEPPQDWKPPASRKKGRKRRPVQ